MKSKMFYLDEVIYLAHIYHMIRNIYLRVRIYILCVYEIKKIEKLPIFIFILKNTDMSVTYHYWLSNLLKIISIFFQCPSKFYVVFRQNVHLD